MKKIIAMVLLVVVVLGLFTGCTKEMVTITEKEPTTWVTNVVSGKTIICVPHHGWNYKGVNSNGEEVSWRSTSDYEIGETVEVIL